MNPNDKKRDAPRKAPDVRNAAPGESGGVRRGGRERPPSGSLLVRRDTRMLPGPIRLPEMSARDARRLRAAPVRTTLPGWGKRVVISAERNPGDSDRQTVRRIRSGMREAIRLDPEVFLR